MPDASLPPGTPYCSHCKYPLAGLTESSKCPECGRPLVEVLTRGNPMMQTGKRYRSKVKLFGLPVIDVALGPKNGEMRGKAKGIIAIGDVATGWLAIGGLAHGIVALGGVALGLFTAGGLSVGLLVAAGGGAIGAGLSAGGGAVGGVASGGGAIGYIAQGGGVVGYYARGGSVWGKHTVTMTGQPSAEAQSMFDNMEWFFGPWPPNSISAYQSHLFASAIVAGAGGLVGLLAFAAARREPREQAPWATE